MWGAPCPAYMAKMKVFRGLQAVLGEQACVPVACVICGDGARRGPGSCHGAGTLHGF